MELLLLITAPVYLVYEAGGRRNKSQSVFACVVLGKTIFPS